MTPIIPALDPEGWVTSPLSIMAKLWEYYQASDYSQSNTFYRGVTSLKYTLQKDKDILTLTDLIKDDIRTLYGSYFDSVEPMVEVEELKDNIVKIVCEIRVTLNTEHYELSRAITGTTAGIINYETKLTQKHKYDVKE